MFSFSTRHLHHSFIASSLITLCNKRCARHIIAAYDVSVTWWISSGRSAAALLQKFCSQPGSGLDFWSLVKWKLVSPTPEGWLSRKLGAHQHYATIWLGDRTLQKSHAWQAVAAQSASTSRQYVLCLNSRIDEHRVRFLELRHAHEHH